MAATCTIDGTYVLHPESDGSYIVELNQESNKEPGSVDTDGEHCRGPFCLSADFSHMTAIAYTDATQRHEGQVTMTGVLMR